MASAVIRFRQGYSAINSPPLQEPKRSALLSFDFICPQFTNVSQLAIGRLSSARVLLSVSH
jgi:hypothetical protein